MKTRIFLGMELGFSREETMTRGGTNCVDDELWRRRPAGGFAMCERWKNRRRDAGATKTHRSLLNRWVAYS